jgi:hypothetical protein
MRTSVGGPGGGTVRRSVDAVKAGGLELQATVFQRPKGRVGSDGTDSP